MATAPVRFKRVPAVFYEVSLARLCESSGSEHSPENSMDLFYLVNSFIERDHREDRDIEEVNQEEENGHESQSNCSNLKSVERLRSLRSSLLGCQDDEVKRNIRAETEQACRVIRESSSPGFKRRLMTRLRERAFDAGLCKSKWEKFGRYPSGQYEYIDANVATTRYIIEVCLAGEFEIARPTDGYTSLLHPFPPIFVGEVEELKQVVKTMSNAIKESMKRMGLQIAPWRRYGYMQAKWFGSYKRTINEAPAKSILLSDSELASKRLVGFAPLPVISYYCRQDVASKYIGSKVGLLAAAFSDTTMLS